MFSLLIAFGMIYGLGHWIWRLHHTIVTKSSDAAREHDELRRVAEAAASDAASCAAVIDKLDVLPQPRRRRLQVVRDEARGVSNWNWE